MKTKIEKVKMSLLFLFLLPLYTYADVAATGPITGSGPLVAFANKIMGIILLFPKLLIGLALVYFFYGLSEYVYALDEKKKKEARETMFYGVIGLFVMVSVWGIVYTVAGILGL